MEKKNNLKTLTAVLNQYYQDNDRQKLNQLTQLLQNDMIKNPNDPFMRHYYLMSLSTLYHLDFLVASIDDQNELIDYFFNISYWQFYDLCLLENVVNMIHVERSTPYISDILKQYATNNMPKASVETVSKILINALETSIIQRKDDFTRYLLDKVKKYKFNTDDFKFQTWLLFWTGVFENNNNKIRHAYSIATYLHQNITLKNFDKFLTITQTPSPFFEDTKKDTPKS